MPIIAEFKMWAGLNCVFILIFVIVGFASRNNLKTNPFYGGVFLGLIVGTIVWGLLT